MRLQEINVRGEVARRLEIAAHREDSSSSVGEPSTVVSLSKHTTESVVHGLLDHNTYRYR